jgi:hypothetical protein
MIGRDRIWPWGVASAALAFGLTHLYTNRPPNTQERRPDRGSPKHSATDVGSAPGAGRLGEQRPPPRFVRSPAEELEALGNQRADQDMRRALIGASGAEQTAMLEMYRALRADIDARIRPCLGLSREKTWFRILFDIEVQGQQARVRSDGRPTISSGAPLPPETERCIAVATGGEHLIRLPSQVGSLTFSARQSFAYTNAVARSADAAVADPAQGGGN